MKPGDVTKMIHGSVGPITSPGIVSGWVRVSDLSGGGLDVTINIYLDDKLIGSGKPSSVRKDIVDDPDYLSGFQITCTRDVPEEAIAFEKVYVEASKPGFPSTKLPIWDRYRSFAFAKLFEQQRAVGEESASAIITGICQSQYLKKGSA